MTIEFTAVAQIELYETIDYYDSQQAGLGEKFLIETLESLNRIANHPQAWQNFSKRTRRCLMRRFPCGLIYEVEDSKILVLAVQNLHQDPKKGLIYEE